MPISLTVRAEAQSPTVEGEFALAIAPGTRSADIERLVRETVVDDLNRAAAELGAVVGASTEAFVREKPGRDADGRTVFLVRGRLEGGRLLPSHRPLRSSQRRSG